uniref:Uncharacterized protein n=1 Tax=Arundo donax TaxID=35708 RepID=A0A0A9AR93_ARUDO
MLLSSDAASLLPDSWSKKLSQSNSALPYFLCFTRGHPPRL